MISHSCDFCGKQGISPGDIWHVFFSQKSKVTNELRFDICDDCGAELIERAHETMKKACSTKENFRERMCRITYREDYAPEESDCQIIECSNGCLFYWPTCTPLFYCPKCGARVVNENKPVEVWQPASADDVTCHEVREDA